MAWREDGGGVARRHYWEVAGLRSAVLRFPVSPAQQIPPPKVWEINECVQCLAQGRHQAVRHSLSLLVHKMAITISEGNVSVFTTGKMRENYGFPEKRKAASPSHSGSSGIVTDTQREKK